MDYLADLVRNFSKDNPLLRNMQTDPLDKLSPEAKARMTPRAVKFFNCIGLGYFYIVSSAMLISSLLWTLPVVYDEESGLFWSRATISTLMFVQVYINYILVIRNRGFYSNAVGQSLGIIPDPSWSKCLDCDHLLPPRGHHCPLCRRCVLRRDHHCFFSGACVGYANQRYFIVFVFYCAAAGIYSFYVTWTYLVMVYAPPYPVSWGFYHYLLPVTTIEWIFGYATIDFLYFVLLGYLSGMTGFGSAGICCWQLFTVAQGITSNEFWRASKPYQQTVLQNFRDVFGQYWIINFIIPAPFFKTPGNGIEWNTSKFH